MSKLLENTGPNNAAQPASGVSMPVAPTQDTTPTTPTTPTVNMASVNNGAIPAPSPSSAPVASSSTNTSAPATVTAPAVASPTPATPTPAISIPEPASVANEVTAAQPTTPSTATNVSFSTDKIGQWAAKQEKPFATQNQKEQTKKAERIRARKKALPFMILGIILGVLLIGGIVALIVALNQPADKVEAPEIYGNSDNDIYEYQDSLSEIYKENGDNFDAVSDAVDKTLATESGKANQAQVRIAEAYFFAENSQYQRAIDALSGVDPATLSIDQQVMYYDTLYYANTVLGNKDLADEYFKQSYEIRVELGGEGG